MSVLARGYDAAEIRALGRRFEAASGVKDGKEPNREVEDDERDD